MQPPWLIDARRTALLVIDMQNDFLLPGAPVEVPMARERLPIVKQLLDGCRAHDIPVIYTQHMHRPDGSDAPLELLYFPELQKRGLREGTPGVAIAKELAPQAADRVVQKQRYDAFYHTNLDTILRTLRTAIVDTVIISGTVTNICCESTARSAYMRDYKVVFSSDATAGLDMASHNATLTIIGLAFGRVLSTKDILGCLPRERAS